MVMFEADGGTALGADGVEVGIAIETSAPWANPGVATRR